MLAASATLYRALFRPEVIARERASAGLQRPRSKAATVLIGLVLGFILGLTSVGSGALVGLALILLYRPGVWIGAALLPYVPVAGLRHALGIILAAAALGVLTKAGVSLSPAAVVGIPAALAVVSVVVHRVDRARVREQNRSTRR